MKTNNLSPLPVSNPVINEVSGDYRPHFFDLEQFNVSKVNYSSVFYADQAPEPVLLKEESSFYYLREDKLRVLDIYLSDGNKLKFKDFTNHFGIKIKSGNLFKTGKYLSRIFRPVKYGCFFPQLNTHISNIEGKVVDGISLISLDVAKAAGWDNAEPGMSAQFTLFSHFGLIKGHCVISDKIDYDVVVYGEENIKKEISSISGADYLTLEPVGLSDSLRMDIQSMLNLWGLFGPEQYLSWAYTGVQEFKKDLFSGNIEKWLDDFNSTDIDKINKEKWTLKKAIYHKVEYTKYPGLVRAGWTMFRQSILNYSENIKGEPVFRIPVPNGKRGYIRVDLRDHDESGSFIPKVKEGTVELDHLGNLWVHPQNIELFMSVLGGADQDDGVAVIPVQDNKAVIYRNPNQYGEYWIYPITYNNVEVNSFGVVIGDVAQKTLQEPAIEEVEEVSSFNSLFDRVIPKLNSNNFLGYNTINLLRAYSVLKNNSASIGLAANAEMIRTALIISNPDLSSLLFEDFNWNLENIIDASVKEGLGAEKDMEAVSALFDFVSSELLAVPKSLLYRIPERLRANMIVSEKHILDELFNALKLLVERADLEVLGSGTASKGNRIPGLIDYIDVPIKDIGLSAINSGYYDQAVTLLKGYNKSIAILLENTKDKEDREVERQKGIEEIQSKLLKSLTKFDSDTRSIFTSIWAYEIYKTNRSVHDSILWISDKENIKGTSDDTIRMLCNVELGTHIKQNGSLIRYYEAIKTDTDVKTLRIWDKDKLDAEDFSEVDKILVENGTVLLKDAILKLGDECTIEDGLYSVRSVAQSVSRKDNSRLLRSSLTVYLV